MNISISNPFSNTITLMCNLTICCFNLKLGCYDKNNLNVSLYPKYNLSRLICNTSISGDGRITYFMAYNKTDNIYYFDILSSKTYYENMAFTIIMIFLGIFSMIVIFTYMSKYFISDKNNDINENICNSYIINNEDLNLDCGMCRDDNVNICIKCNKCLMIYHPECIIKWWNKKEDIKWKCIYCFTDIRN
jgi:hypothetical protein